MNRPAAALFLFASIPALAQERSTDTARVDPVIITATRVPLSQANLPVAVTVITGEELRLRGITSVGDALTDLTSAYVAQAGSPGATTSLFLRGGESKYVKVLVDGVPANDPGGAYDFASLTTDNLERIEIVRGPASVLYGADAVTGVVHIITRRGVGAPRVEVDVRAGAAPRDRTSASEPDALRTYDATATMTGALSSGSYAVGFGRHHSTGLYELNNRYQNNTFSGRAAFSPARETELRLSLRYTDYQYNYPTSGSGDVADSNAYRTEDRTILGIEVERAITPTTRAALSLSSSVNDGGTDDALDQPGGSSFVSLDKIRRRSAELQVHLLAAPRAALSVGAQLEQQDQRSQSQGEFAGFPFTSQFRAARRNLGAYGELLLTPGDRLTATLGARLDDNERFGALGTGRVGLSWRALHRTRVRASAGTAFREPTFFENYATGFVTGNPELHPERSRTVDLGVEQDFLSGRGTFSVTGFAQQFRNIIDYEPSALACGYSYCNVAEARSNGLEGDVRAQIAGPFTASAGVTLLRTRVVNSGFDQTSGSLYRRGEPLIRRPATKWNAELLYAGTGRFSGSARVTGVGERDDRHFGLTTTPVTLRAYDRVDVSGQYVLPPTAGARSAITLRVENLTNEGYQNVFNFLAPRRTVWLGVRSTF
jgi:vitamin B12 transporter